MFSPPEMGKICLFYTRGRNDLQNYYEGFFSPCEAEDAALLTQGKDDNEAGQKKDKQETANLFDHEYNLRQLAVRH